MRNSREDTQKGKVLEKAYEVCCKILNISAAVTSLAKFGAHCENLLPSILVLLSR